jgi:hypothetical protein
MCSGDDYVTKTYGNALMSRAGLLGGACPMVVWCCSLRLALVGAVSRVVFLTSRCGTVATRQLQNRTHGLAVVVRVYFVVRVPGVWCCSLRLALVRAVSRVIFLTSRCWCVLLLTTR